LQFYFFQFTQIVTSTEKRPITRFFITTGAKRNLFCNSDASEYSHLDVDTVTSSIVESDSEPYVDSGDEYKPEEISESDSDNSEISESPFSLKDADTHKKNKKNIGSKRKLNKIDISESPFSLKDADTHKKNKKNIGSKRKLNKIDISESPFSLKDADTHEKNKKNIGSKGELNKVSW
jgi:hypothetical protein